MDHFFADLRYAARQLRKAPGFTAVAVVTLALGIGANTAMFSLVRGVLLRPLPYPQAERLVTAGLSLPDFDDLRRAATVFDETAVWASNLYVLGGEGRGRAGARRGRVRALLPACSEGPSSAARSRRRMRATTWWCSAIASGHAASARIRGPWAGRLRLSGERYTVVGVMGPEFQFPNGQFELWVPLEASMAKAPGPARRTAACASSAAWPGSRPASRSRRRRAQVSAIAARLAQEHPKTNEGVGIEFVPIYDRLVGGVRTALLVLMGVVALVLLIASANVANLLLARAKSREREIAIRTALGAGRGRLVRQLLTESVLLSAAGSVLGVLLARWILDAAPHHRRGGHPAAGDRAHRPRRARLHGRGGASPPDSSSDSRPPGRPRARTPRTACAKADAGARARRRGACARGSPRPRSPLPSSCSWAPASSCRAWCGCCTWTRASPPTTS